MANLKIKEKDKPLQILAILNAMSLIVINFNNFLPIKQIDNELDWYQIILVNKLNKQTALKLLRLFFHN